jgi:tetratricopeptide (TPR) repeat protein
VAGTTRFTIRVAAPSGAATPDIPRGASLDAGAPTLLPGPAWPFVRHTTPHLPASANLTLRIPDLHRAFPAGQNAGTRLVLTQATYQLQRWLDWLDDHPLVSVVADCPGSASALRTEASAGRGPWSRIAIETISGADDGDAAPRGAGEPAWFDAIASAFAQPDPRMRAEAAAEAALADRANAAVHLALASARMELLDFNAALDAITDALALAPDWEAAHFEHGKLWLRADDTERAAAAFAEALRLMPSFSSAAVNLGGALAEAGRPADAVPVLEQALRFDPRGHTVLSNLGAAYRELGRLADAEGAFRRVIALADGFVFGHYNLGHTLFLQGRFAEARDAYAEGAQRDPQQNLRQACRRELARAAAGDGPGAVARLGALAAGRVDGLEAGILDELDATLDALASVPQASAADVAVTRAFVRSLIEGASRS